MELPEELVPNQGITVSGISSGKTFIAGGQVRLCICSTEAKGEGADFIFSPLPFLTSYLQVSLLKVSKV